MAEPSPSTIEQDIVQLEKQLQEKKAALEQEHPGTMSQESVSEKEILRDIIGERIQRQAPLYQPAPASPSPTAPPASEPPSYFSQELKDKIQEIIAIVFDKNLEEGIKEATRTGNASLIDAFHDILVDELYDALIAKKKLDKID